MTGGAGGSGAGSSASQYSPGTSTNAACAACKHQRRKCTADCPLAPYFPPDQPKRFHNVHKLYGVSNVLRILRMVDPSEREDAVKSIVFEADTREKDPVHGCLGVISLLQNQLTKLREDLAGVRDQLYRLQHQQQQQQQYTASILNQSTLYATTHHHQRSIPAASVSAAHLQLQQEQLYGSTSTSSHANFHDDSTTQANSFFDAKLSLQQPVAAYLHDHSQLRYNAAASLESTPLHDMFGHQLKVEGVTTDNVLNMTLHPTSTIASSSVDRSAAAAAGPGMSKLHNYGAALVQQQEQEEDVVVGVVASLQQQQQQQQQEHHDSMTMSCSNASLTAHLPRRRSPFSNVQMIEEDDDPHHHQKKKIRDFLQDPSA